MAYNEPILRTVQVIRYVTPLREGGSLPAIAEADDEFLYVLKFRGAGQGVKSLIAELIGGEIARVLGFRMPEIVFANLDAAFGRSEPDEEIQDLLKTSIGLNLGVHYLSGSITFDPVVTKVDPMLASRIVWLDALLTNVDRTARNTNMLVWNKELWLIDHGASLYFHHSWDNAFIHPDSPELAAIAQRPFVQIKDHVLLPWASELEKADMRFRELLTPEKIRAITGLIPEDWLTDKTIWGTTEDAAITADQRRSVYTRFLETRVASSTVFINEAQHARKALV